MPTAAGHHRNSSGKLWRLCLSSGKPPSSASSTQQLNTSLSHSHRNDIAATPTATKHTTSVSSIARSFLPARRRLRLDPSNNLYFPYEPGKQVKSAVKIKNTSKSHVAFKFQTTSPKSCYMRPPWGILAPGESIIAIVFKFVEQPENNEKPVVDQKKKAKFKIMSLKVKKGIDFVPELRPNHKEQYSLYCIYGLGTIDIVTRDLLSLGLSLIMQFDEQKDQVNVERVLHVIFLDPEKPTPALEKLKRQLVEAEAAIETHKKPPADTGSEVAGEGLVIDEWKARREKHLARQQIEVADST